MNNIILFWLPKSDNDNELSLHVSFFIIIRSSINVSFFVVFVNILPYYENIKLNYRIKNMKTYVISSDSGSNYIIWW